MHNVQRAASAFPAFAPLQPKTVIDCGIVATHYGAFRAVRDTHMQIAQHAITALIGPSGCGKSTVLRCFNRINDVVPGFRLSGQIKYHGVDVYQKWIDPVALRRHIGMIFQQPNPFAMSIFDNVRFGLRTNHADGDYAEIVERALRRASLWEEVKDNLHASALALSGGQQQRLCIARAIAIDPDVLLMDEPCAALDPIATRKIEALMLALKQQYTIVLVTHNLQQAARISDYTGFMYVDPQYTGYLVEFNPTQQLFTQPQQAVTQQYLAGEFG